MTVNSKTYPTMLIHNLHDPNDVAVLADLMNEARPREPEEPE